MFVCDNPKCKECTAACASWTWWIALIRSVVKSKRRACANVNGLVSLGLKRLNKFTTATTKRAPIPLNSNLFLLFSFLTNLLQNSTQFDTTILFKGHQHHPSKEARKVSLKGYCVFFFILIQQSRVNITVNQTKINSNVLIIQHVCGARKEASKNDG